MKKVLNKRQAWLPVILMILFMCISIESYAEKDSEQEFGQPAGTPGHTQNQESEKPLGKRGLHLNKHPKNDTEKGLRQSVGATGHKQNKKAKKPLNTRKHR
jgi:hypothetical protein